MLDVSNNTIANLNQQLNAGPMPKKKFKVAKKKGSIGI